ncbi:hypothetical protein Tco_1241481, partial [Tanacetum coccineum]
IYHKFDEVCANDELQTKKIINFRLGGLAHSLTLLEFARRLGLYQATKLDEDGFNISNLEGGAQDDHLWFVSKDDRYGSYRDTSGGDYLVRMGVTSDISLGDRYRSVRNMVGFIAVPLMGDITQWVRLSPSDDQYYQPVPTKLTPATL